MATEKIALIEDICGNYGAEFLKETVIAPYTSFKIGGKCNIVKANSTQVLTAVIRRCRIENIPYHVIGKGSNVLISGKGLSGVVIILGENYNGIDFDDAVGDYVTLKCQAGEKLSNLCRAALLRSLTGLEFAYGIPGTAGGALCMNAGAYGGEIADVVESCICIDSNSEQVQLTANEMKLSYRHSIFCENSDLVITRVNFKLKYGDRTQIKEKMDEVMAARREKQPLELPSAGSTFKRPEGHFAAKLIEESGLKGKLIGGAAVSEKHAGFIVNKGNATFENVIELIEFVKAEVLRKTGVTLECEIKIIE